MKDNYVQTEHKEKVKDSEKKYKSNKRFFLAIKRLFDFVLSLIILVIVSPVILIIACAIKIDSPGPAFFKHKRIGKNGSELFMYKFRSMVTNAEDLLKNLTPEQQKEFNENFKLDNDFRITKVGKFLRKSSLDELPQLLNIIKGDMSIVGPRPIIQKELEKYGNKKEKFLSMKPGLTGYWQANGRSNTTYEERIKMELFYIDHCSLWMDAKIIFGTVMAVIRKEGAK